MLFRDGHTCQCCKGKSKDKVLNVHHIESRKTGGDAPNNLVTLCETCHTKYHKSEIVLPKNICRGIKFSDATFMGVMRWVLYEKLRDIYFDIKLTYGYITKHVRIQHNLLKSHYVDARCISKNVEAVSDGIVFYMKKVRCHNRQIHKMTINKGGIRKLNQAFYKVKGFHLYDRIFAKGKEWYIYGRRTKGCFLLKTLTGDSLNIIPSKIQFLGIQRGFIVERRTA